MSISPKVIKKLFSLSAGRCNHCGRELLEEGVQIGEMAHVIAKSANGPRAINGQANDNSYENLILLCPNHHAIVDKKPKKYPPHILYKMKDKHESWVASQLDRTTEYKADLAALQLLSKFMPLLELRAMVKDLPLRVRIDFDVTDTFENFLNDQPTAYPFRDNDLTSYWQSFINDMNQINAWVDGNIQDGKLIIRGQHLASMGAVGVKNYVANDLGYMVINAKELGIENYNILEYNVYMAAQNFLYSYTNLIEYIRENYRELGW